MCVNETRLCDERFLKRARVEETFGFTFHPGTECTCCKEEPIMIMGWRYHCNECDADNMCSNQRYISAHPIDHNLVLIRTPAPEPVDAVIAVVEKQKWVVNSIMDRYPIK
jgi:hypothetical protein